MKNYLFFPSNAITTWQLDEPVIIYTPNATTNDTRTVNLSPISNASTYLWEQIEPNPSTNYATITPNNTTKNIVVTMPIGVNVIKYRVVLNGNRNDYKYVDILDFWSCNGGVCISNTTGGYTSQAQCNSYLIPAPPFIGGQMTGVSYKAIFKLQNRSYQHPVYYGVYVESTNVGYTDGSSSSWQGSAFWNTIQEIPLGPVQRNSFTGPITSLTQPVITRDNQFTRDWTCSSPNGVGIIMVGNETYNALVTIVGFMRTDGQPDTGGNPPGSICPLPPKWKSVNGVCTIDPAGNYNSSRECEAALIPPPFYGGQCAVTYLITVNYRQRFDYGGGSFSNWENPVSQTFNAIGPITSIFTVTGTITSAFLVYTRLFRATNSSGAIFNSGRTDSGALLQTEILSIGLTRTDGNTDNCGSLPPTSPKWKCVNGVCINDSTGTYNSQAECESALIPPAFFGGQSAGVPYKAIFKIQNQSLAGTYYAGAWPERENYVGFTHGTTSASIGSELYDSIAQIPLGNNGNSPYTGPITNIAQPVVISANQFSKQWSISSGAVNTRVIVGNDTYTSIVTLIGFVRSDGQPDTGGNLPSTCP